MHEGGYQRLRFARKQADVWINSVLPFCRFVTDELRVQATAPNTCAFGAVVVWGRTGSGFLCSVADDAIFRRSDEPGDILDFGREGDLFFDLDFGIFE